MNRVYDHAVALLEPVVSGYFTGALAHCLAVPSGNAITTSNTCGRPADYPCSRPLAHRAAARARTAAEELRSCSRDDADDAEQRRRARNCNHEHGRLALAATAVERQVSQLLAPAMPEEIRQAAVALAARTVLDGPYTALCLLRMLTIRKHPH